MRCVRFLDVFAGVVAASQRGKVGFGWDSKTHSRAGQRTATVECHPSKMPHERIDARTAAAGRRGRTCLGIHASLRSRHGFPSRDARLDWLRQNSLVAWRFTATDAATWQLRQHSCTLYAVTPWRLHELLKKNTSRRSSPEH